MFGKIDWFGGYNYQRDMENEFGFIDIKGGDVYFHKSTVVDFDQVEHLLNNDQLVELECEPAKKGLKASSVKVLKCIKHLNDAAIDELKDSGLRLSTSFKEVIEHRLLNRISTWEELIEKAEEWICDKSKNKSIDNLLYSPIRLSAPCFDETLDISVNLSPSQYFSLDRLQDLMSQRPVADLKNFLDQFGFILNDDDLNFGLKLYLDHSSKPKRKLFIKFFRRLDQDHLTWLAQSIANSFKVPLAEMTGLLKICRSMSPLYHMTHKSNLKNILEHGLVSHNEAHKKRLVKSDISLREAQAKRGHLHNQVPLYFNPRNTMLYCRKNLESDIVMIAVNPMILLLAKYITNGNGASSYSTIYEPKNIKQLSAVLESLDWGVIMSDSWYSTDQTMMKKHRRMMCAEALIDPLVPPEMIEYVGYSSKQALEVIKEPCANKHLMCLKSTSLYFDANHHDELLNDIFSLLNSRGHR